MTSYLPQTMKAAAINEFGGPDNLKIQTIPIPEIAANEVLIKVEAAGIGSWDATEREGQYDGIFGLPSRFPYILGWDGAGTIAAVGSNVKDFKVGDAVYAASTPLPKGGFYAEYKAVSAENVAHIPKNITMKEAAAMPWCALTALSGLDRLELQPGETLMIIGASGGIGHLAVQFAKRMGVKVFAVASGADGVALVKRLGADEAVDGLNEDIVAAAAQFAPKGIDSALALISGESINTALAAVRPGGRVAHPDGVWPVPIVPENVELRMYNGATNKKATTRLNALIESGPFVVHIDTSFPLEQVVDAHKALKMHYIGKLVLTLS